MGAHHFDLSGAIVPADILRQFPLPVAATALQQFLATAAAGMGRDDDTSVARMIAAVTGVQLPKKEG